jgi:uncharacterized protein
MLTATFSVFKGLSRRSEMMLWQKGICSWKAFQHIGERALFSPGKRESILIQIEEAQIALRAGLIDWFLNRLESGDKPRAYPHCRDNIRYLDIETTGCSPDSEITTIAVYDGEALHVFIKDMNLHRFPEVLMDAEMLVTFNGIRFDLPFLRKRFGLDLAIPHIDLLAVTKAYGYSGGLKACEKKMGIDRGTLSDADGKEAVRLWQRFSNRRDKDALGKLITYNCMDVLSLEAILIRLYNESMCSWPHFRKYPQPAQPSPKTGFQSLFDN